MNKMPSSYVFSLVLLFIVTAANAESKKKVVTDAIVDLDFKHQFEPVKQIHNTKVLIDKFHQTIYKTEDDSHGAHAMLDIMRQDGFKTEFTDKTINVSRATSDVLIIHGLPNDKIVLDENTVFWKSPIKESELDSIVHWVANGGGLFLTLSHFPGGSGAKPLLEAFDVKFRDGYAYSSEFPSFVSKDGRCSNFFGMSERNGLLAKKHPIYAKGLKIAKVDFHCGAAVFRHPEDVVIAYPKGTGNYNKQDTFHEVSDYYAAMIAFEYGKGKVVVATDQGMFRNFIFTFDEKEKVYVTITSPDNDNANLFVNMMRWLSPNIRQ